MGIDADNFLDCPTNPFDDKLLLPSLNEKPVEPVPSFKVVTPLPGFCLKTKNEEGEKAFINVCKSEHLPRAKDITDSELVELLSSDDPSSFRVPLSLGEPRVEMDNSGNGCTVYDVMVNAEFYKEMEAREILKQFLIAVAMEGLEEKYRISLNRNIIILKAKKCLGTLSPHNIRTASKPWIMEMDDNNNNNNNNINNNNEENGNEIRGHPPEYTIIQDPLSGPPSLLNATIHLPKVKTVSSLTLDIGEDRILLTTRSKVYHLDIYLPFDILQDQTKAQFNRKNKLLVITMPVASTSGLSHCLD